MPSPGLHSPGLGAFNEITLRVILKETIIFDRRTWYFLDCRFSSEEMERGCDQVEESFEVE